jgi:hypothetical protein
MHRGGIAPGAKDELESSYGCIAPGAKGEREGVPGLVEKGSDWKGSVCYSCGLFLSEVNRVGEFFQAWCMLARPCFLPLGFRGDAAAPM